jgi:hypothetical protein
MTKLDMTILTEATMLGGTFFAAYSAMLHW